MSPESKDCIQNCKQLSKVAKNNYVSVDVSKQKGKKKCIWQNQKYPTDSGVELSKIVYKNSIWVPSIFRDKDYNDTIQMYLV